MFLHKNDASNQATAEAIGGRGAQSFHVTWPSDGPLPIPRHLDAFHAKGSNASEEGCQCERCQGPGECTKDYAFTKESKKYGETKMGDWTKYISFTCWGSCRYGGIPEIFGCLSGAGKVFDSITELKSWKKDRQRRDAPSKLRPSSGILITRFVFTFYILQFGILNLQTDRFTMVYWDLTKWQDVWKHLEEVSIRLLAWMLWKKSSWSVYPQIAFLALSQQKRGSGILSIFQSMAPMLGSEVKLHKGSTSMFVDMQAHLMHDWFSLASCMCQAFSHGVLVSLNSSKKLIMEHLIASILSTTHFNLPLSIEYPYWNRYMFFLVSWSCNNNHLITSLQRGTMFDFDDLEDTAVRIQDREAMLESAWSRQSFESLAISLQQIFKYPFSTYLHICIEISDALKFCGVMEEPGYSVEQGQEPTCLQ